ncbi:dTDP-4-dehydrorhamnose 3,5-epimerase [Caulobacter sp. S45]|uniref:dTDP-4-dehydrorhamnose 3,5-epimerase n=1 Tax=Caulobacter sp. S45 TaxID=1641861 RepID=UPI0020B132E9|nr:dTDP-4-dehydrorhamnose 3,5-epimerase [Caulobacter sp. S45]
MFLVKPKLHSDSRGVFSEVFRQDIFDKRIGSTRFVQENHSRSRARGVLRGLHYQASPRAQGKLVRVVRGAIYDVAVDVRLGSPTYGRHVAVELNAEGWSQFWIPVGFLHGFCALTDDVEVIYKTTDFYSYDHDRSIAFDDPDISINWPINASELLVSEKDRRAPLMRDAPPHFNFDEHSSIDDWRRTFGSS